MSSAAVFKHDSLDRLRLQIRLIKLNTDKTAPILSTTSLNKADEPIELSISTHNAENAPSYNALSYTWGLPEPSRAILINGGLFRIRENLWEFFRSYITMDWSSTPNHVQRPTEYLWIDQICIDQDNAPEKSQQIQRMGDIFGGAQLIISWLGPEDHNSLSTRLAMEGFPLWEQYLRAAHQPMSAVGFPLLKVSKQQISAFLSRSYWSRLWIIQELVLSKAHFFLCGDWVITPKDLFPIYGSGEFQDWVLSFWNPQSEARGDIDIPNNLPKLVVLFHWTGEWHCQKPHDKIYGLLGLAKERMEVDYTKSLEELAEAVLEMAEPLMAANLKYWVSMLIRLVSALEKALEVELHSCSTVPKLWVKVLKSKSKSDREIVLKESSWDYRDEWKLMKLELMALLNS